MIIVKNCIKKKNKHSNRLKIDIGFLVFFSGLSHDTSNRGKNLM